MQQLPTLFILNLATLFLVLFCVLGAFDGVYFHLIKFKLHTLPSAKTEHLIHTIRAFVFAPIAILLFVVNSSGPLLFLAIGLALADLVLEYYDIMLERDARAPIGGVPGTETVLHVFASSAKLAAVALSLAAKPLVSFSLTAPIIASENLPTPMRLIGFLFAVGSFLGGVASVAMTRTTAQHRTNTTRTAAACNNASLS